ncbi:MAG: thioredoxin family protein [Candidatus Lernaella stagnicola]|nr:thioredoxin family protein [Candidatus Lernaella stagnicola]
MRIRIRSHSLILLVLLATLFAVAPAAAEDDLKKPHVSAELIADVAAVKPGDTFRAGIKFTVDKDWHIYWSNPGEAGLPTKIAWQKYDALIFGPAQYPEPVLFGVGTPLSGYGYEKELLLYSNVTVSTEAGGALKLQAEPSWLVCKHICLPGKVSVSLELPVADATTPSSHRGLFDAVQKVVPVPVDTVPGLAVTSRFNVSAVTPGDEFTVMFVLNAPEGKQIAPRAKQKHPLFSPLKPVNYDVLKVQAEPHSTAPRTQLAVQVTVLTWPELDKAEKAGGTFQFVLLDGKKEQKIAVDFETALPFAAAGTPVEKIELPDLASTVATSGAAPFAAAPQRGLLLMLLFAFAGGIILNIMPCVLPVLSIKVLSVIQQSDMTHREIRNHGIAYTVGILGSFLALAIFVAILKGGGEAVGWGFQFQSPVFVSILAAVVFVFGLSMLDVFLINTPTSAAVQDATVKEGLRGSFFNGIFATVLATPCTAPFLGTAVGFAFTQPIWVTFMIFMSVGLGLAFPFLLLAFVPAWTHFMPKPGDWMDTFKAVMAFLLMATVIWLLDVLGKQAGAAGMTRLLVYLGLLGFASWLYGRFGSILRERAVRLTVAVVAIAIALGGGATLLRFEPPAVAGQIAVAPDGIPWQRWSEDSVTNLVADGKTVFVDFTAAWCWTCKVNEKAVIESEEVKNTIKQLGIIPLKGDYTNRDPEITDFLKRHGKAGVPVYAVIGPKNGGKPVILPEVLTKDLLINALNSAAKG